MILILFPFLLLLLLLQRFFYVVFHSFFLDFAFYTVVCIVPVDRVVHTFNPEIAFNTQFLQTKSPIYTYILSFSKFIHFPHKIYTAQCIPTAHLLGGQYHLIRLQACLGNIW